jgi:hypothetical protein
MYDPDEDIGGIDGDPSQLRQVPDLAGMAVEDASGVPAGRLVGALIEGGTGLVRYIDLDLARLDRHVLVPIGHARVREHERDGMRFRLRAALLEDLEQIPPFPADVGQVDDPFERELLEAYGRTFHGERYYAHPSYDHVGVFTGERQVTSSAAGGASGRAGELAADSAGEPVPYSAAELAPDSAAELVPGSAGEPVPDSAGEPVPDSAAGPVPDSAAGPAPLRRLAYLPGWRIAAGEPDVRGWRLALDGASEYLVHDLIIDMDTEKVRYVVVASADGTTARLLPLGFLELDGAGHRLRAPGLASEDVVALPAYEGTNLTREKEDRLCAALRRRLRGRRRYSLPDFRTPPGRQFPGR